LYRIPAERIAVIPHGVEHDRFRPPGPTGRSEKKEEETVQRLIGPGPYFLAVGTVGVRKNLCALIDAMALLRHGSSEGARLVLVGHPRGGPGLEELERRIAKHRLGFGIVRPGYVPDALIPALYRGALGFCFPSLHEGFGLPILEAMACGTPVLCSGEGAIGEVAGSAAVAIDVRRPDSIATEMRRLAEDSAYRERKAKEGIARAAQFTWRRAARETYAAYLRAGL
jgi:alpha-1,3-rhamnosyl/mannosyltransferase